MAENPPLEQLKNEIATFKRDLSAVVYGGVLAPNDATLAERGGADGYDIYDRIERDCHAYAVLQKRKAAVVSREFEIVAASDEPRDQAAADLVREAIGRFPFDRLCEDLLDAVLKGFAVAEIIWAEAEGKILPESVKPRAQRRFTFDIDSRLRLKTRENTFPGEELPERKFVIHRFGSKDGNPYGLGLGTRLFWPVFFKRHNVAFWLAFAERFGSPGVVGQYEPGASGNEIAVLKAACRDLAQDFFAVFPKGMGIEFKEAVKSGTITSYESLVAFCDREISKAVLGETGTTDQQGSAGSRARDQVGNEVRLEIAKADADLLSATLNETLFTWITEVNLPGARPPKIWRLFKEPEDLKGRADRDEVLSRIGVRFSKKYFLNTYSLAEEDIERLDQPGGAQADEGGSLGFAEGDDQDAAGMIDQAAAGLADRYDAMLKRRIEQVLGLLEETRDIETFSRELMGILNGPPPGEILLPVFRGLFSARLMGRTRPKAIA